MRIENLRLEEDGGNTRLAAAVIWEDCDRPVQEIYFETEKNFADGLSCNPHPFVVAAIVPAFWLGEARILIEGEICPELRDGLTTVMSLFKYWYVMNRSLVRIEAKTSSDIPSPRTSERSALFFTGGIDSFAALRLNRLNFRPGHAGYIKDGIIVYGLEVENRDSFTHVINSLSQVADNADMKLMPVFTNIRYLHDDWVFWYDAFMGAALCAVAHAFNKRLTAVSIASDYDIPNLRPHGSHPLIEPNFSSCDLKIKYDGITVSRLEKTRLISDWDIALQNIRVCNKSALYRSDLLNCGECEKCIRTMLALLVLGVLDQTRSFGQTDVTEEQILSTYLNDKVFPFYEELIPILIEKGRHDLAKAIKLKMSQFLEKVPTWKFMIKQIDRKYLNCGLTRFNRILRSGIF